MSTSDDNTNETFVSHLLELRTRLLYAFGGLLLEA